MNECEEIEEGHRAKKIKNFVKLDQEIKIGSTNSGFSSPQAQFTQV